MLKRIKISSDTLKLIALVSMTIDHIGYLLLPEYFSLRVIGRLAFPIFAYYVAVGVEHTRDVYKYMYRVMVFACITQILFYLVGLDFQNVLFYPLSARTRFALFSSPSLKYVISTVSPTL